MFRNTGANAVAKYQTRLAYEDKRDLYCIFTFRDTCISNQHHFVYICLEVNSWGDILFQLINLFDTDGSDMVRPVTEDSELSQCHSIRQLSRF